MRNCTGLLVGACLVLGGCAAHSDPSSAKPDDTAAVNYTKVILNPDPSKTVVYNGVTTVGEMRATLAQKLGGARARSLQSAAGIGTSQQAAITNDGIIGSPTCSADDLWVYDSTSSSDTADDSCLFTGCTSHDSICFGGTGTAFLGDFLHDAVPALNQYEYWNGLVQAYWPGNQAGDFGNGELCTPFTAGQAFTDANAFVQEAPFVYVNASCP